MGIGDEQAFDEILLLGGGGRLALAATALGTVFAEGLGLCIALVRQRHDDVLLGDEVLQGEVKPVDEDLGTPFVTELLLDLE